MFQAWLNPTQALQPFFFFFFPCQAKLCILRAFASPVSGQQHGNIIWGSTSTTPQQPPLSLTTQFPPTDEAWEGKEIGRERMEGQESEGEGMEGAKAGLKLCAPVLQPRANITKSWLSLAQCRVHLCRLHRLRGKSMDLPWAVHGKTTQILRRFNNSFYPQTLELLSRINFKFGKF